MILLDSSVVVALFRSKEDDHQRARKILEYDPHCIILDFVIAETMTVLKIRESLSIARQCHEFLMGEADITIHRTPTEEFDQALQYFMKNNNRLSLVDTLLFILHKKTKTPVATFDKDLAKLLKKT